MYKKGLGQSVFTYDRMGSKESEMMRLRLYVMRHGETILNYFNKIQGWADAPLTDAGVAQVLGTAKAIKDIPFQAVYSSDLGRTLETARLVLQEHNRGDSLHIQADKAYREVFFGSLEGLYCDDVWGQMVTHLNAESVEEVEARYPLEKELDVFHWLDQSREAENAERFHARVKPGLANLIQKHQRKDDNVLLVGHGLTLRLMIQYLVPNAPVNGNFLGNASLSCIEKKGDGYHVDFLNHMPS